MLRRTYRDGKKVKHQTLGNLSHLPTDLIDTIRRRLRGEMPQDGGPWQIVCSLPHGHVTAILQTLRRIGLENVLASRPSRERTVVVAMIVARILKPGSKLATLRALRQETATTSLSQELDLEDITEREIYEAIDWLTQRQRRIENKLAKKHLQDGTLLLYDVSSSYYTGTKQGLVRFGVHRVVFVGDRGMLTSRRIDKELRGVEGLDWISALRTEDIRKLVLQGAVEPSLFDQRDLAEVTSADFPDERLIVCHNRLLADRRAKKRSELLDATEKKLDAVVAATQRKRRPLRDKEKIGLRVGKVLGQHKVGKHFVLDISDTPTEVGKTEFAILL